MENCEGEFDKKRMHWENLMKNDKSVKKGQIKGNEKLFEKFNGTL